MVRNSSLYVCQQCNYESSKWLGKCPECDTWGSMVETLVKASSRQSAVRNRSNKTLQNKPIMLSSVSIEKTQRISTKISELDRVLGGGIVSGQVILIAGEPGIGKSTILLQLAENMGNVLYVSGEESAHQIKIRAERLGVKSKHIQIMESNDVDEIIDCVSNAPRVLEVSKDKKPSDTHDPIDTLLSLIIIDSIQTVQTSDLSGMTGSAGQVRECAYRLTKLAKSTGIPVIIVGHITKEGTVAGPALLMHIVDTVLWFEGAKEMNFRMIRARKNRFGATDEVGIFVMEDKGLISLDDASQVFVNKDTLTSPGSCVSSIMEGTRPFLVEIQSLLVPSKLAFPKRVAYGIDSKKLELILAVLNRRVGLKTDNFDVFVNAVGGIKIKDPAVDFAIALSIASAYFDKPLPAGIVAIGEVGLMGEVHKVNSVDKRVKESSRLGFKKSLTRDEARTVREAISILKMKNEK